MTDIKGTPPVQPTTPLKNEAAGSHPNGLTSGNSNRQRQDHPSKQDGGPYRSNSSVFVSQNALETRMAALQDHEEDGPKEHRDPEDVEHLLVTLTPEKTGGKEAMAVKETQSLDRAAKVEEIAKLVSTRIESAMRTGPIVQSGPLSLTIPLDPMTGLKGVQVIMNDGTLTVTLVRGSDQVDHNIQQAALNLGQILQCRFPTRVIKIAEKLDAIEGTQEAENAVAPSTGFADLLQTGQRRS